MDEEKHNEAMRALWLQAGKGLMEFVEAFGLPAGNAGQIAEVVEPAAQASDGAERKFEVAQAGEDRCVARYSRGKIREQNDP